MFALYLVRLRGGIVAARLGGLAQCAGGLREARSMTLLTHYRMFGHYNAWANARLYDAAAQLDGRTISRRSRRLLQIGPRHAQPSAGDRPDLDAAVHRRRATRRTGWMRSCSRRSTNSAPRARPRTGGSSISSTAWTTRRIAGIDQIPPRLVAGSIRAATGACAGALVQSPDPPPRPGPCPADRPRRPGAGTRSAVFPAAFGETRRPDVTKTSPPAHTLSDLPAICQNRLRPRRMQQNCAPAVINAP